LWILSHGSKGLCHKGHSDEIGAFRSPFQVEVCRILDPPFSLSYKVESWFQVREDLIFIFLFGVLQSSCLVFLNPKDWVGNPFTEEWRTEKWSGLAWCKLRWESIDYPVMGSFKVLPDKIIGMVLQSWVKFVGKFRKEWFNGCHTSYWETPLGQSFTQVMTEVTNGILVHVGSYE